MNIQRFVSAFESIWPGQEAANFAPIFDDPCADVSGYSAPKNLRLLNLAFALLDPNEAYLEVGTWVGKSLISAMKNNADRTVYACDNFSEFGGSLEVLRTNLLRYGLWEKISFFDADFRKVLNKMSMPIPVGLYYIDGAHDEASQRDGVKIAEDLLADTALVIVDDWRFAADSQSYAKIGTERAIAESKHAWTLLFDLPARFNGDQALWWNGVGVFAFQRV